MAKLFKTSLLIASMTLSLVASDILVTVNGKNITKQDVQAFVTTVAPNVNFETLDATQKEMIKQKMIENQLLAEHAQKEGIEKTPKYQEMMEKIRNNLTVQLWVAEQFDNIIISDSEAKSYFEKNTKNYLKPAMRQAKHILVKEEKEAQEIIDSLKTLKDKALVEKFSELAKSKSIDPSAAQNGGELGEFSKEQMVKPFADAAWAMKEGEMSQQPVKTRFGYHIIYLEKIIAEKSQAYEEVKEEIIQTLKQQQFEQKITELLVTLRKTATITEVENNQTK